MHHHNPILTNTPFVFLLILIFIFKSCGSGESPGSAPGTVSVEGYRAEPGIHRIQIRTTGELLSYEQVELRTPVAGNVLNIHFREGQRVQKGALIAEIDNRALKAQKRGLEAQLQSASGDLQRQRQMLEFEGASIENVEQSEAVVSNLQAQIDELAVRIELTHIRAPFSGTVGMRNFSPGAYLAQGDMVTQLVQSNRIKINFNIPARYAALAREELEVKVVSATAGDTTMAKVYAVDPFIDPVTRSLNLRAMIDNENNRFIPGDFVQILMEADQDEQALLIPSEAIISELNAQVVFLASNGTARRKEVEVGTRTSGRVHITRGLMPGDTVIITGLLGIRDGSAIEISGLNQEAGL
jgi:membrane fusion protein, multidrug efflux system